MVANCNLYLLLVTLNILQLKVMKKKKKHSEIFNNVIILDEIYDFILS